MNSDRPGGADGPGADALPTRLRAHWRTRGWGSAGERIAVALSGGVDSLVLLHLLRFPLRDLGFEISAAHFEHRMRPEGPEEVAWLRGVAGAWGVTLHLGSAEEPPRSEEAARVARYRFLEGLLAEGIVDRVLTAHQADDQVETILFRILRGTGIEGLAGIPEERGAGILRPLLPFGRAEIEAYARRHHLRPRHDPTNRSARFARGRVRHRLLPLLEEVHPGAKEGVLRLAQNASAAAGALECLLAPRWAWVQAEAGAGFLVIDRARFLGEPEPVRVELVRGAARALGLSLTRAGTEAALQFMTEGASGGERTVTGGLHIARDFDRIRLTLRGEAGVGGGSREHLTVADAPLLLPSLDAGGGSFTVGGHRFEARWGCPPEPLPPGWEGADFDPEALRLPLTLRGWRDGDRTRTSGGGRKVKKVLGELRIPRRERSRLPLLVDASGEVLWIPGVHRAPENSGGGGAGRSDVPNWRVEVRDVGTL